MDRDLETGQETGRCLFTGTPTSDELVNTGFQKENFHGLRFRINEPVFADAVLFVEITLVDAIPSA